MKHALFAAAFALALGFAPGRQANADLWDVEAVMAETAGVTAGGASFVHSISADGRLVLFGSHAANLGDRLRDQNGAQDVFVHDVHTGAITLVSHAATDPQSTAAGRSAAEAMSADGRWIVFRSTASDVLPDPYPFSAGNESLYLHDRDSGTTRLITHWPGEANRPLPRSHALRVEHISDDGSLVLLAGDLSASIPGWQPSHPDQIAAYDRDDDTIKLITHVPGNAAQWGDGDSRAVGSSADGRWVLYDSAADDLVMDVGQIRVRQVYLYDRQSATTKLVSVTGSGLARSGASRAAAITPDGRHVLFTGCSGNLTPPVQSTGSRDCDAFLYDRTGPVRVARVSPPQARENAVALALSDDARWVLVGVDGGLLLHDHRSAVSTTVLAPLSPGDVATHALSDVAMGADARHVLYRRGALPLLDGNDTSAPYLFERDTARTTRISGGEPAFGPPTLAPLPLPRLRLSRRGGTVVLGSARMDLVASDRNGAADVFLFRQDTQLDLVSRSRRGGKVLPEHGATAGLLSADGRWFTSIVRTPRPQSTDADEELFLHDAQTGTRQSIARWPRLTYSVHRDDALYVRAMTPDGRWLLINSRQPGLADGVPAIEADAEQAYLYDRQTGNLQLISHAQGAPLVPTGGVGYDISDDGRHVLLAQSILRDTGNGPQLRWSLYLHDTVDATRVLVTHKVGQPETPANGGVRNALLSADGSIVALESDATDLVNELDGAFRPDVFVYDVGNRTMRILSGPSGEYTGIERQCWLDAISDDGQFVLFTTDAADVIAGVTDTNNAMDVFLHDVGANRTRLLSHRAGTPLQTAPRGWSSGEGISADGRTVTMMSEACCIASGLSYGTTRQYVYETRLDHATALPEGAVQLLIDSDYEMHINSDGSAVAYGVDFDGYAAGLGYGRERYIKLHRLGSDVLDILNPSAFASAPVPNGRSHVVGMSADGDTILFQSTATNLVANVLDGNSADDVFIARRSDRIFASQFESN